jgi:Transport and Golgi organisation 2
MCTVSFVATKTEYIFTFNRDENIGRTTPIFNAQKNVGFKNMHYAKDVKAGGTWFVVDDAGSIAMLFNGAFVKHDKALNYTKSRGIILLELFACIDCLVAFEQYDLLGVEPFSIILFQKNILYRLVWNGTSKSIIILPTNQPHIFSSATLYGHTVAQNRKQWLLNYLEKNKVIDKDVVLNFHKNTYIDDKENGLIINRNNITCTLSISQAVITRQQILVRHFNLITNKVIESKIHIHSEV